MEDKAHLTINRAPENPFRSEIIELVYAHFTASDHLTSCDFIDWSIAMPTGYYLACLETLRYVWIGTIGDKTPSAAVDPDQVSDFCLVHRGKALIVISESHQIVGEGYEWSL